MARPQKKGLDYFNLDCIQDDNLTFIEAKHGIEGFGIVIKLWQKIYRHEGYYMQWNEQSMYLFAREIGVNIDVISSVVNTCLLPNISIFNSELLEKYSILTSKGIQKRWLTVVKISKRKNTDIERKYNLLEFPRGETKLPTEETPKYVEESTQTKLNYTKLNGIEEKEENPPGSDDPKIIPIKPNAWGEYNSMNEVKTLLLIKSEWQNIYGKSSGIKSPEEIPKWIEKFFDHAAASGKDHRKLEDAKSHCLNWTRKQIENGKSLQDQPRPENQQPTKLTAIEKRSLKILEMQKQKTLENEQ